MPCATTVLVRDHRVGACGGAWSVGTRRQGVALHHVAGAVQRSSGTRPCVEAPGHVPATHSAPGAGEWRARCPSSPRRGAQCGLAAPDAGDRDAHGRPALWVNPSRRIRTVGRIAKPRPRTQERPDQVRLAPIHVRTTAWALPGSSDAARDCRTPLPEVPWSGLLRERESRQGPLAGFRNPATSARRNRCGGSQARPATVSRTGRPRPRRRHCHGSRSVVRARSRRD